MSELLSRSRARRGGFTLMEMMIAAGILVVGGGIAYPLLVGDVGLFARNISLNKSNNSLRYSLQMLKKDIEMSIEPPLLMSYRVGGGTGILKPADITNNSTGQVTTAAVSAQAVMMWVNLGPAYDLVPTSGTGTGGTVNPGGTLTLKRHISSAADLAPNSPTPQIGDRLVIMSPTPYSPGMPEIVTMDGRAIQKPGRRISYVNGSITNPVADNGSATITVQLDLTNTILPPSSSQINGDKTVYVVREVAYVAYPVTDAGGNVVSRQLLYYSTTQNMGAPRVLIQDLDPNPQELIPAAWATVGATGTTTPQTFNYFISATNATGGRANLSPLSVNLPVRAVDYAHAVAERNLASGQINTSAEFNVFLRSSPQLGVKARLD